MEGSRMILIRLHILFSYLGLKMPTVLTTMQM